MIKIDEKIDAAPLFIQTKEWIISELKQHKFAPGDKIPSENDFCRESQVSIRTIRRALLELEKDGIIVRRQGRGSFLKELKEATPKKSTGTIGILFSDMIFVTRPTFSGILQAIEARVHELGYSFHLYSTGDRIGRKSDLRPLGSIVPKDNVAGLIATSAINGEDINWIRRHKIPLVTFNNYRKIQTNTIRCDYYAAARHGIKHLVNQGSRNIAFLCGHFSHDSSAVIFNNDYFLQGIKDELKACGIKFEPEMVFTTNFSRAEGANHAGKLFARQNSPDAFFTFDDVLAAGVLDAAEKAGKSMDRDFSLLTCGGASVLRNISTLHIPMPEMGRAAVDLLVKAIEGDSSVKKNKVFETTLEVCDSTQSSCVPV
jgi:DNA-binding LacI/PurR family transcriptional regulator